MFNHKSSAAWDSLTIALIEAGFAITRTWPVKTEAESSMHIKGKAAARTTLLLVCRPREEKPFPQAVARSRRTYRPSGARRHPRQLEAS